MIIKNNILYKVKNNDIEYGTFEIPNNVEALGNNSFYFCKTLISIYIPENTKIIGKGAFKDCSNLRNVNISNGVEYICEKAFAYCTDIEKLFIPDSVKLIEAGAFKHCSNLKNIKLSNNLTSIVRDTFVFCDKLKELNIPSSVIYISDDIAGCFKKLKLNLQSSLTRVNLKNHKVIINGRRIKNEKQLEKIRKKEILNKIIEQLKKENINNKKCFKLKEHEEFIERALSEFVYKNIDFNAAINIYVCNYLTSKGLIPGVTPINLTEINDIKEIINDELKKEENFDYSKEISLCENRKEIDSYNPNEKVIESSNSIIYQDLSIEDIKPKKEMQQENNTQEILKRLSELPKKDFGLVMDIVKNNLLDPNIEEYINMSNEEKLKLLRPKVSLEKEPIEEYKARQKLKRM